MALVRIVAPEEVQQNHVGLDFIAYVMHQFAEKYEFEEYAYNIYRRVKGMEPITIARVLATSNFSPPLAGQGYSFDYTALGIVADLVIEKYLDTGQLPEDDPADPMDFAHNLASYGLVLDADDFEYIVGIAVVAPTDVGCLTSACLAELLMFFAQAERQCFKLNNYIPITEADQDSTRKLRSSVNTVWDKIYDKLGESACQEANTIVRNFIKSDDPRTRTLRLFASHNYFTNYAPGF